MIQISLYAAAGIPAAALKYAVEIVLSVFVVEAGDAGKDFAFEQFK